MANCISVASAVLWVCGLACLAASAGGCGGTAPTAQPPEAARPGAAAYHAWLMQCLADLEADIPSMVPSAEAAADFYLQDGVSIGSYGDPGLVGELSGRAGGLMQMDRPEAVARPGWKGVVLMFPREDHLPDDLAAAGQFRSRGCKVIAFGRPAILQAAGKAGVEFDAAIPNHAAPHGGLFRSAGGQWLVPTDPTANIAAAWSWLGEFVAALTRRGKMPPLYASIIVPGAAERADKLRGLKFHPAAPAPVPPGEMARQFLQACRVSLAALRQDDLPAIARLAELALQTRRAGHAVYTFAHGHAITRHVGCPHDPGYLQQINRGLFDLRPDAAIHPGDLVFCVGYDRIFQGWFFKDDTERMRAAGARLAWSMTDYNTDPNTGPAAVPKDEILIHQHWAFGDAVAAVPGYDVRILPTSGVIAEAVLWMTEAEVFRLLAGRPAPEPAAPPNRP